MLFVKVVYSTLAEYRWYFPPDFEHSSFLGGRRSTFVGLYPVAFYIHLFSGPLALALASLLLASGGRSRFRNAHRFLGKLQLLAILGGVVPSGVVMARQAYGGPIAATAFFLLAAATGGSVIGAAYCAWTGRLHSHRRWALRCFLLLMSPLLLRLLAGATIVLAIESEWSYRVIAWISWLLPLAAGELWCYRNRNDVNRAGSSETRFGSANLRRGAVGVLPEILPE